MATKRGCKRKKDDSATILQFFTRKTNALVGLMR